MAGRDDLAVADVEAVGEHQRLAGRQVGSMDSSVDLGLGGVGRQDHDHIGLGAGIGNGQDAQTLGFGLGP